MEDRNAECANATELGARVGLSLRLDVDEWNGVRRVRFLIEGAQV